MFKRAGYAKPTPLQQRVIPLLLRGKDVSVEVEGDSGKTAAFILPLLARLRKGKTGIKAVVLTSSAEKTRKVFREFGRYLGSGRKIEIFAFGPEGLEKKEYRGLAKRPDVVIGTPNRVIDHIRRGNLDLSAVQMVVIDWTEKAENPGFAADALFVFSKLPQKKQTILLVPSLNGETAPVQALLRHPVVLPLSSWKRESAPPRELVLEAPEAEWPDALVRLILAERPDALLIQCPTDRVARKIHKRLKDSGLEALLLLASLSEEQQNRVCQAFSVGQVSILVTTFTAAQRRQLRWVTDVMNLGPPPGPDSYKPRSFMLRQLITLGSEDQLARTKETLDVNTEKKELPAKEQVFEGLVKDVLGKVSEEDPETLKHYRNLFRKQVPLPMRAYVAAYLLKQSLPAGPAVQAPARPAQIEFMKLFISMGRNRGIFPRDLVQLFMKRLSASRSQIGAVKVMDNYSFVDIDSSLAERAIKELSGLELKGKTLAVNYARKKESK
jgi:ATP-dependent RNA helicase DeaD